MEINKRENIGWIDLLRVTACFLVVFAHCCDPFVARFDTDRPTFLQGCALGSAVRCCVPLFVMMTGVLLFPVRNGMSEFYKKRIGRIVVPLIFWSVMLPVLYFIYLNYITTTDNPTIDMSAFTLEMTITKIWTFIFNFNYDTTPLWYLYMLVGLYFIIPIFHAWLERATRKDIKLFLSIWGISLFLPYIKMAAPALGYIGNWGNMDILSVRLECIRFILLCFRIYRLSDTGPLSGKIPAAMELEKNPAIGIPMFVTGYAITFGGYLIMQEYFPGNYAYLEIVWLFGGINVFMMTFPVFVCIQKLKIPSSPVLSKVASMTFGIYLCHFVFVQMGYDLFASLLPQGIPAIIHIICMAVTAFLISYLVVRGMYACKWTRRFVA